MEDEPEYDITIARVSGQAGIGGTRLIGAIEGALRRQRVSRAVISVALVDDAEMAHLNKRHLGHEGSTDVLAFNMGDDAAGDATRAVIEGEIVISVDTAAREADRRKHSLEAELALYAVHGTLHLLGYDDQDEQKAARMHRVEDEVLASAGLGRVYGTKPV